MGSQRIHQVGFGAKTVSDPDPLNTKAFKKAFSSNTGLFGPIFSDSSNFGLLAHVTTDISLSGA